MSQARILESALAPSSSVERLRLGGDRRQTMTTLLAAGLPVDAPMQLRFAGDIGTTDVDPRWFTIGLEPEPSGHGEGEGYLVTADDGCDFPRGVIAHLWLDGALSRMSHDAALAWLTRAHAWLAEGATLRIDEPDLDAIAATLRDEEADPGAQQSAVNHLIAAFAAGARDAWFPRKLHRTLDALGFEVSHLSSNAGGSGVPRCSVTARRRDLTDRPDGGRHRLARLAPGAASAPTLSIVVLTFNGLSDTQQCLDSLARHTHVAHELIVVDNGSEDGTPAYLRAYAAAHPHVRLILNRDNRGFAAGNNLGLAIARGRFVILLNNDTVVTDGWAGRLIDAAEREPNVGLVGPRSNYVSGPQLVPDVPYRDLSTMTAFAADMATSELGRVEPALRLVGFCLLVRREVVARIGALDERFGRGNYEDDDWCLRAHLHGFEARIACDVFIHHGGSRAFRREGIDYPTQLADNWEIFKSKWGIDPTRPLTEGYPETLHPPDHVMDFIPLPRIETDHTEATAGRIWEPTTTAPSATAEPPNLNQLFDDAEAAAQGGDWEAAATIFDQMVMLAPNFGPGHVGLASAALATGAVERGIAALEAACRIYPDECGLRVQMAVALAHMGQLERAQATFLEALDIDPDHLDALVSLAQLCRAAGNFVEAVELLGHASRTHPDAPVVLGAIGMTALDLGDRKGAEATLERMRAVAPEHPETHLLDAALARPGSG
ncbi:MAG: glycosyltransferase [Myxococcota bacterium]